MTLTFTLPNIGLAEKAAALAKEMTLVPAFYGCYTNNAALTDTMQLTSLDVCYSGGVTTIAVTGATPMGGATNPAPTVSLNPVTFTADGTQTLSIWGVFVAISTGAFGQDLVGVTSLASAPQVLKNNGDNIVAQCTITDTRAAGQP